MAELDMDDKNGVSHRGMAARKALDYLKAEAEGKEATNEA